MKRLYYAIICLFFTFNIYSQTGTEFWFAAPEVTSGHNDAGPKFRFTNTSSTLTATVIIDMPAQPWTHFNPDTIAIAPNGTATLVLDAPTNYTDTIENKPTNTVLTKGIHITSDVTISAYYEVDNNNNNEIFALKGANGLGTEFYIPITLNSATVATLYNQTGLVPIALSTFDIVATENNTTVMIYSHVAVDGHAANIPFTVTLNRGETYSCGWSGANYQNPANQPAGAVVLSDKPIAITVKEDSKRHTGNTCYDLMGDQIVPVEIIGTDYVVIKGQLNATAGESFFVLATQNNTKVYINGSTTPVTTLFAGQTYYQDNIASSRYYIHTDKPVYCTQVTGFGCELGSAILPPLNCAGSSTVNFVRSIGPPLNPAETFYLNIMVRAGSQGNFKLYGGSDSLCIVAGDFDTVPGTNGEWVSTYGKSFTDAQVPVGTAMRLTNSTDVFAMGLINGAAATGCRFGFFSEYAAPIVVDAGSDDIVCANKDTVQLNGSVTGGVTTGTWSSSGTGTFIPNADDLNAQYDPSFTDILAGTVTLTLSSTGHCTPVTDEMDVTIDPAPVVDAGANQTVCANNTAFQLNGSIQYAIGGQWSGGTGSYNPNNTTLNAIYTPSAAEISAGSVILTLTSIGNGNCYAESDLMTVTITPAPVVNANSDQTICANNPTTNLNGSVMIGITPGTGIWSGGAGTFNPSSTWLNATYTPTVGEILAGSVTLSLTSTNNGTCNAVNDNMTIFFSNSPTTDAGTDQIVCANKPDVTLNGSVTIATGGQWSGGLGTFTPNNTTLNAVYTPTNPEVLSGSINLILTTTGNGTCNAVTDTMRVSFSTSPTANAGADQTVCANNPNVTLNGSVTLPATGGQWLGGAGSFAPNSTTLNAVYTPAPAEITAGTAKLYLTTTGSGNCNEVTDSMTIAITTAPTVNAGSDQTVCKNNPDVTITDALVTVAAGGTWTGGTGTYAPDNNTIDITYTPSAAEITAGTPITLTLTSTGNGICNAVNDNIVITFTNSPTANAGSDQTVCSNNPDITLNGATGVPATGGQWSGGLGTFTPNNTTLNAVYTPTNPEVLSGSINLILTTTGNGTCNSVTDTMRVSFSASPTANAGIDQTVCANNPNVTMNGSVTLPATGGQWSGGAGSFAPNSTALGAVYTPAPAEIAAGTAKLYLTTTGSGSCNEVMDSMNITITSAPVVSSGTDQTVCKNNPDVTIDANITIASGGTWSGGAGTYTPDNTTIDITYTPSAAEITAGTPITLTLTSTGNGTCNAVSDNMIITFTNSPTASAGADQTVCANNPNVTLGGAVGAPATGGQWSGGLGTFSPNNTTLNAVYIPSAADIIAGSVTLTLTTTGNGICNAVSDNMIVTITGPPVVEAGSNVMVCANKASVVLSGASVSGGASTGKWTGGTGVFTPNDVTINATYIPSPADISAGFVTLTLTSTSNGNCNAVSDNISIIITPKPIVNAGVDLSSCVNNPTVTLNGNVSVATGGIWTGGGGIFIPNNTTLTATYTPSASEITARTVTLTLTSTGNGDCNPESDNMTITINEAPVVNAGADQTVCANKVGTTLNGSISFASGGVWTGGAGAFSPNNTTWNAVYTPTPAEITTGSVTLTLTSTGNGNCNAVSDNMTITITPSPVANAGLDQTVCANNPNTALSGVINNATGGKWTSSGFGSFIPNDVSLNATYVPNAVDTASGSVKLILTSTGNGSCYAVADSMCITITDAPNVNAGPDQTVCVDSLDVPLAGMISGGASAGIWTSTGTGTFTPTATTLNATYHASAADSIAGSVTLYLTSTNHGVNKCSAVSDNMTIYIYPPGFANASVDQTVCGNNAAVTLNGSVSGGSVGGVWRSSGTGSFVPNNTTLKGTYIPSGADISAGSVTLTLKSNSCNLAEDNMKVTITPAPVVNAGSDITVCYNSPQSLLNGSITVATGGVWTGGAGTYNPNNTALNATYTPSAAEITAGSVTLTLTSTGNGNCLAVSDAVKITITKQILVEAGSNMNLCSNNSIASLNGSVTGGTVTGQWSTTGTGSFSPNNTTLNASYISSPADITAGSVLLYLVSTNNGGCPPVNDMLTITYYSAPVVNAGANQTVCANNSNVSLSGSVSSPATGGVWSSTGTGTFVPSSIILNPTYIPSAADTANKSVTLILTSTGNGSCIAVSDSVGITIIPAPYVNAGIDQTVCVDDLDINLNGTISGVTTTGQWSTTGTGTFTPNNTTLNAVYHASSADSISGVVNLTLVSTNNVSCLFVQDQMRITITTAGVVNAGSDATVCSNKASVSLNGSVTGGASKGRWTTSGTGTFSPSDTILTGTTYVPSSADTATGSIILTLSATNSCNSASDNLTVTLTDAPSVNAGSDQTVCANNVNVTLNGSVTIATGGVWSGGSGSFSPNNTALNAVYTPSPSEISSGSATLILTSTGNGSCNSVSDNMMIRITSAPVVNAGTDQTVCITSTMTQLSGFISGGAIKGKWTTLGSGNFLPNDSTLNAYYEYSSADTLLGSVTLVLTSTNNGKCLAESDNITITFGTTPYVNAGSDQIICANNLHASLNGTVSGGATTGKWTKLVGMGTFTPNDSTLNATYNFTSIDSIIGWVRLKLTSTNNGSCIANEDEIIISIQPLPKADAGTDQTICADDSAKLTGVINNALGGQWSSLGIGSFIPNNTTLNVIYVPSSNDIISGSVKLVLVSTGNINCSPVTDTVKINITPLGIVSAGSDQTVCKNSASVSLNGTVTGGASTGKWTSSGTGNFLPNNTTLNATYVSSSTDTTAGSVVLTLTAINSCNYAADNLNVTYKYSPVVNAGADQTVCGNNATIALSGSVVLAIGGIWTTSGTGTFVPNNTSLNTSYIPSASDISAGFVNITLRSTGNGNCNYVTDVMKLTITPAPVVNAGPDQTVCKLSTQTQLMGSVSGGATTGIWTTSGTGTFTPNNTTPGAYYIYSNADTTAGSVTLTLTSTGNGNCNAEQDAMKITFGNRVFAYAGENKTACADNLQIPLTGIVTGGTTTGIWTTSGTGTFSPNNTDLNATYNFSFVDSIIGSVNLILTSTNNGGCLTDDDTIRITLEPIPIADAGSAQTICETSSANLSGVVTNATGGIWTSNGTGIFSPNNITLNAVYTPDAGDISSGSVKLILTTTGNSDCNAATDTVTINITTIGIVNAGTDQTLCGNNANVSLSGSVTGGASTGIWTSSGTGTFTPNSTALNATYISSFADVVAGSVILTLSATNSCDAVSDNLTVSYTSSPVVNAGTDQTVCGNNATTALSGSVTLAAGGIWTTSGSGTFAPNNTNLATTYIPGSLDISSGAVFVYLTSSGNGNCNPVTDSMEIIISPAPVVNAGPDEDVCKLSTQAQLMGKISGGASKGVWISSGTGTFSPDNTTLNAYYIYSSADTTAGSVTLTLTSTDNGNCVAEQDVMTITFGDRTFVYAGEDITACADSLHVPLNGFVTGGAVTGAWKTSGTGTFTPNDSTLNAVYDFSNVDSIIGSVQLILTSTNNSGCLPGSDTLIITEEPSPSADAGMAQTICEADSVKLSGVINNAAGGQWLSLGTGTFIPNDTVLNATYVPGAGDISSGSVKLVLSSTGNVACSSASDTIDISIITPLKPGFTYTTPCADKTISFTDTTSIILGSITSWSWNFGNGMVSSAQDTAIAYDTAGAYSVTLTVASNLGCLYNVTQIITVNPTPVAGFTSSTECFKDFVLFTDTSAISGGSITSWEWNFGDGGTSTVQNPAHKYSSGGNYNVTLIITGNTGCSDTIVKTIDVYPKPAAGFTWVYNCLNSTVTFTDTSDAQGVVITSWQWDFGDGTPINYTKNPVHLYSSLGNYLVRLIVSSSGNCTDTVVDTVVVSDLIADFGFTGYCAGDITQFSDSSEFLSGTINKWKWNFGDTDTSDLQNPAHTYAQEGNYNVTLIVESNNGCKDTATIQITIYPKPIAGFGVDEDNLFINVEISFTDSSSGANSWNWDFGDNLGTSTERNPVYIYTQPGIDTVTQIVTNQYNCSDVATKIIIIAEEKILPPKLPTGFSPNDDGMNDVFYPRGGPFKTLEFKIYNGWGELVFETTDTTKGWDGTRDGIKQPIGVYIYTLKAETINNREYKKTGDVTLIR